MLEKMKILQSSFYRITKEARSEKTSKTNESSNDNDDNKSDSRRYGLIDKQDIIGDVSLKYYPFKEFAYDF